MPSHAKTDAFHFLIRLDSRTPEEIHRIGGKGCGLVRLLRAGLPVPEAWCIPVRTDTFRDADFSPGLVDDLDRLWDLASERFGKTVGLAVRSSATAEDLKEASFAGIYLTRLGVTSRDGLIAAVRECREAVFSDNALAYRRKLNLDEHVGAAIILQRMVRATTAGVMMTVNPLRPFAGEYVINASWGLGESVVSGRVEPDQIVLDAESGRERRRFIGRKDVQMRMNPDGIPETCDVADVDRSRLCLTDRQIRMLYLTGRMVDLSVGPRQDIEWAFEGDDLYVLQQRPVTGLPPLQPENIWSRKFGDEYLAEYAMPLNYELMGPWITEEYLESMARMQGREDLVGLEPTRNHEGYSYISGVYIARMLRAVPRSSRENDAIHWFPPSWTARIMAEPFQPLRVFGILNSVRRDPRAPIRRNPEALRRHCRDIEDTIVPLLDQDYTALNDAEWRRQFDAACEKGREHFRVIRWGVGFYSPMLHGLTERLLKEWADDRDGRLYQAIISGLPGTRTAEINRGVWALGCAARDDERLRRMLGEGVMAYDRLRAETRESSFWDQFDRFVRCYGHRAATRDISQPRWRETPDILLGLIQAQVQIPHRPSDPAVAAEESMRMRERSEKIALAAAGRGFFGWLRAPLLKALFRRVQCYTVYRENQRFHLDFILTHLRSLILEQGRRLALSGVVDHPADVFFLGLDDFRIQIQAPRPSASLTEKTETRRAHWLKWKDRRPATYLYDDVETEGEAPPEDTDLCAEPGAARGLGASGGAVTGPARVILKLEDMHQVRAGDILVTGNIDPGWTSVFPLLGGLITETGGILAHGALLAREYGIPAVMGVPDATTRFNTGDRIELDGSMGKVKLC